jgi:hypothetical protein
LFFVLVTAGIRVAGAVELVVMDVIVGVTAAGVTAATCISLVPSPPASIEEVGTMLSETSDGVALTDGRPLEGLPKRSI